MVCFLQKGDETGKEHPVHYISRSLSKSEKNYGITDLEGSALIYCINCKDIINIFK